MAYNGPFPQTVKEGGTGDASFTVYAPVCGGTTTTGALQSASTGIGTSGFVLTSTGAGSLPTFQNVTAAGAITQINGDSGSITGGTVTIYAHNSTQNSGSSVSFTNSGTTSTLNVTDANNNTIVGNGSGNGTLTGSRNTSLGYQTLTALTSAVNNTAIGWQCLTALQNGGGNCGVGHSVLTTVTSGSQNSAMGDGALQYITTGQLNAAFGVGAGANYTSSESSNVAIMNPGILGESHTIRIGIQGSGNQQQNACYIAGITGVTVANPAIVTLNTSTGQLGTTTGLPGIVTWTAIGANQTLAVGNGYFCTTGAALSLALPATSAVGDTIRVILDGSTSWTITQPNAATRIRIGSSQTTLGVGGSLASTAAGDSVELVCETANARWAVVSMIGNITVV